METYMFSSLPGLSVNVEYLFLALQHWYGKALLYISSCFSDVTC